MSFFWSGHEVWHIFPRREDASTANSSCPSLRLLHMLCKPSCKGYRLTIIPLKLLSFTRISIRCDRHYKNVLPPLSLWNRRSEIPLSTALATSHIYISKNGDEIAFDQQRPNYHQPEFSTLPIDVSRYPYFFVVIKTALHYRENLKSSIRSTFPNTHLETTKYQSVVKDHSFRLELSCSQKEILKRPRSRVYSIREQSEPWVLHSEPIVAQQ